MSVAAEDYACDDEDDLCETVEPFPYATTNFKHMLAGEKIISPPEGRSSPDGH